MSKILRNPAVLASLAAIILVLLGLMFPLRTTATHIGYVHSPTPVTPTSAPTATQPSGPPSADEVRERAQGISRPGIDTSGGGSNTVGATVLLYSQGTLAGSVEIIVPINGINVQVAFFGPNLVAAPPQTINGINGATGWRTVLSASSKGSNWRNIQIFNASNTLVANFDIKVS
ncbi:MAG: hypothetical protein HZB17_04920 [Chloroflexi bacterium]|nr:hypothetical protein [Chloroflexota bacterium]MBI5348293.1 hypothetical protein [Chloroflexota bacterium]